MQAKKLRNWQNKKTGEVNAGKEHKLIYADELTNEI